MYNRDQAGSCAELVEFFNTRNGELRKYLLWRTRSPEVAEELAQETYLRFLRQPDRRGIGDLNALLFTIATNLARDYLRTVSRQASYEHVPIEPDELPDVRPTAEQILEQEDLETQLQSAIDSLPDRTREIFLLYRADGQRYREIAERLDISERTVEYHIRRALLHFRRCLTNP